VQKIREESIGKHGVLSQERQKGGGGKYTVHYLPSEMILFLAFFLFPWRSRCFHLSKLSVQEKRGEDGAGKSPTKRELVSGPFICALCTEALDGAKFRKWKTRSKEHPG